MQSLPGWIFVDVPPRMVMSGRTGRWNPAHVRRLLVALNECNEWGQLTLLEALALYDPQQATEARLIVERVAARLQHANCAVVLMTVRILWHLLERFPAELAGGGSSELLSRKIMPALVTLVSSVNPAEVVYIALRVLHILVYTDAKYLEKHFQSFFCDFSEPSYVKREKIDLLIYLISASNAAPILAELQRYANDVDQDLAARVVDAIGLAGLRCEAAAPVAVESLLGMARRGAPHLTQRVLIASTNLFRHYGRRFQAAAEKLVQIATITDDEHGEIALFRYEDESARIALLWLIGEYAPITYCTVLSGSIWATEQVAGFLSETRSVQCQLLSSLVQLCYRAVQGTTNIEEAFDALARACDLAIERSGRPEVRSRAAFYRALLAQLPSSSASSSTSLLELATSMRTMQSPLPSNTLFEEDPALLREFRDELGAIASLLGLASRQLAHPRPTRFQTSSSAMLRAAFEETSTRSLNTNQRQVAPVAVQEPERHPETGHHTLTPDRIPSRLLLNAEAGRGLRITGGLVRLGAPSGTNTMQLRLLLENMTVAGGISDFAIQLNKNIFGLVAPAHFDTDPPVLQPGDSATVVIPLQTQEGAFADQRANLLQIAIKCKPLGVLYFTETVPIAETLQATSTSMDRASFLHQWNALGPNNEERFDWDLTLDETAVSIRNRVCSMDGSMTIMAERWLDEPERSAWQGYLACRMGRSAPLLIELVIQASPRRLFLVMRSKAPSLVTRRFSEWLQAYLRERATT
ncbi:beta-adaptin [Cyanidiococcus yangmingshanensis]|uniref:Beta-adaptin n=1 Tax=Cyanidiococcus yangmingshanensis TaxID=2690220 RepID=A0A7J7IQQ3_9RHOD|nr:beta-adaptin [Cyanidiococcus yangmingshanensis]